MREIKEIMERQGLDVAELARRTNIKEDRLAGILDRFTEAKAGELEAIAAALLLGPEELRYFF